MDTSTDEPEPLGALFARLADLAEPQPTYRALLAHGAAFCPVDGFALVAGRAAVDAALRDPEAFTSEGDLALGNVRPFIPLNVDPPRHVTYRRILDPLFSPRRMDEAEADIAARCNRFIDAFVDRGGCHFTVELATPFPSAVFLGLMGLPWDELDTFLRLKDGILRPAGEGRAAQAEVRRATGAEIYAYFDAILDERERHPQDDVLTHLVQAEVDGVRLTRHEVLDICFLFLIAGLDTVTDSLTCMFAFLARHPEHRRRIVADPSIIPAAVEELLRFESPVPAVPRWAHTDTEIDGCPVRAGSFVSVMIGAANVDTADLADAHEVRFEREVNRHLAFGGGVHRCLGSHLARRELRIALREWHRRIPEYELRPGIELRYTPALRAVENLELVW